MRSRPGLWLGLALVLTLGAIALTAALKTTILAFTLGVTPEDQVANLYRSRVVCQQPIDVPVEFEGIAFSVGGDEPSGPPLAVDVLSFPDGRRLGGGRFTDDYDDRYLQRVVVGKVPPGRVAVCFRAIGAGGRPDAKESEGARLYGGPPQAARTSTVVLNGQSRDQDLTLIFWKRPVTYLSQVPLMLERATLWRPGPHGGALLAVLVVAVAVAAPFLLGRALRAAEEPAESPGSASRKS